MREACGEKEIPRYDEPKQDFKSKFKSRFTKNNRYNLFARLEKEERKARKNGV